MRILHISDTHGRHGELHDLPEADVVVHSGDFTFAGSEAEAYDFMNWLCDLPYRHKIFIAGNHDDCMYGADAVEGLPSDVHYLCSSSVIVDGLTFYGVPMFMQDCVNGLYDRRLLDIPCGVDVLVTHQPPFGVMDFSDYGSDSAHHGDVILRRRVLNIKPRCHLFGHEHALYGLEEHCGVTFSNAAVLDDDYKLVHAPNLLVFD